MLEIRAATQDHAAAIARLCTQLGYPADAPTIARRLEELAAGDAEVLVALVDGTVRGLIQISIHRAIESGAWAEIDALVVDESHRNTRIGRALVDHARSWAADRHLLRLRVRTNEKRADAHAFYERIGFSHSKSQRVYDATITGGS
jgi:GNAT superfamily N-acetyltransferase